MFRMFGWTVSVLLLSLLSSTVESVRMGENWRMATTLIKTMDNVEIIEHGLHSAANNTLGAMRPPPNETASNETKTMKTIVDEEMKNANKKMDEIVNSVNTKHVYERMRIDCTASVMWLAWSLERGSVGSHAFDLRCDVKEQVFMAAYRSLLQECSTRLGLDQSPVLSAHYVANGLVVA
jgi:hypothetical protein